MKFPINRPIAPVHNNQRDGHMRQTINKGKTSYEPNSLKGGCPFQAKAVDGGFTSYAERIDAKKVRDRSKSFMDHFSQARMFFNSQSQPEKKHIIDALRFELGKVETVSIRERMLFNLSQVDKDLAQQVADGLGMIVPKTVEKPINRGAPADDNGKYEPIKKESSISKSAALSMMNTIKDSIKTRKIAFLVADGVDTTLLNPVKKALEAQGAVVELIAPRLGMINAKDKTKLEIKKSFLTTASVLYDAGVCTGWKCSNIS